MELAEKQKYVGYARMANREGRPMQANDVIYQLLEIANNDIGAARGY